MVRFVFFMLPWVREWRVQFHLLNGGITHRKVLCSDSHESPQSFDGNTASAGLAEFSVHIL